jgi:hypothetical protein
LRCFEVVSVVVGICMGWGFDLGGVCRIGSLGTPATKSRKLFRSSKSHYNLMNGDIGFS